MSGFFFLHHFVFVLLLRETEKGLCDEWREELAGSRVYQLDGV